MALDSKVLKKTFILNQQLPGWNTPKNIHLTLHTLGTLLVIENVISYEFISQQFIILHQYHNKIR